MADDRDRSRRDDFLPGIGRPRSPFRSDSFPTVAREVLASAAATGRAPFPFESWALANRFCFPLEALAFLCCCESAAEAFLAREVARTPGACFAGDGPPGVALFADDAELSVHLQVRTHISRIDLVVFAKDVRFKLAIEVDGMGFHHRAAEQVAADYLRERRLVLLGFAVVRFTAQEVFETPAECWRQILAIVAARRSPAAPISSTSSASPESPGLD